MAGNEKKLNSFSKKAEEFLKSEGYDSLSTPAKLDEIFIKALKLF